MSQIVTVLDGHSMINRKQVHQYLSERFNFPDYYGNNLDALYDLMSTYQQEDKLVILLIYSEIMLENLGDYGQKMIQVFQDASQSNPLIDFRMKDYVFFDESEMFINE